MHPFWWIGIGAAVIWLDYGAGPSARFPVLYAIPVILAAWYSGWRPAFALATAVPFAHIGWLMFVWTPSGDLGRSVAATGFRGAVVLLIGLWFARLSAHEREIQRYVQRLEGLLAICSFCKGIRNKVGEWEPRETFISTRSRAEFTHGMCPRCSKLHYPDFEYPPFDPEDVSSSSGEMKQ